MSFCGFWAPRLETNRKITIPYAFQMGEEMEMEKYLEQPYELPNSTAYCETCASIGNIFWNQRMFLFTGDAKYIDVLE